MSESMMRTLKTIIKTPFFQPDPPDAAPYSGAHKMDGTLQTLFSFIQDQKHPDCLEFASNACFERSLEIATSIIKENGCVLAKPPTIGIINNSIPLFLEYLTDTSIHLSSLCPVPLFDNLELSELLQHCIEMKVGSCRAAWAIHSYAYQQKISEEALTNQLKRNPNPDSCYFINLCYELYQLNIVLHEDLLIWLIDNVEPDKMLVFKKEIISSFAILVHAFRSPKMPAYLKLLRNDLLCYQSHLIQLSILSKDDDLLNEKVINENITTSMAKRACVIKDSIQEKKKSFSSFVRHQLYEKYPFIDISEILTNFHDYIRFTTEDEKKKYVLELIDGIFWFNIDPIIISSILACLIKNLSVQFPIPQFVEYIYRKLDDLEKICPIFVELQCQGLFNYFDFLKVLKIHGYTSRHKEETVKVLSSLPTIDQSERVINQLSILLLSLPQNDILDKNYEEMKKDIPNNVEKILKLPTQIVYQFGLYLIDQNKNCSEVVHLLIQLHLKNLIPNLFDERKEFSFNLRDFPSMRNLIIVFHTRGNLEKFITNFVLSSDSSSATEFARLLDDFCQIVKSLEKYSEKLKLKSTLDVYSPIISSEVRDIFKPRSYLCSLHVYDAFHGIKRVNELTYFMNLFLSDFFNNEEITADILFDLYKGLVENITICCPFTYFIELIINAIDENDIEKEFLFDFFLQTFETKYMTDLDFMRLLMNIYDKVHHKTVELLVEIFIGIFNERPQLFQSSSTCTNDHIVKFIMKSKNLGVKMIKGIKCFPSPSISKEMFNMIDNNPNLQQSGLFLSLLPHEFLTIQSDDELFEYYVNNLNASNFIFWTLWLKKRNHFNKTRIPLTISKGKNDSNYDVRLVKFYMDLIINRPSTLSEIKYELILSSWELICSPTFIENVGKELINIIKQNEIVFNDNTLSFIHPILISMSNARSEIFCDAFRQVKIPDELYETFTKVASTVFITFVSIRSNELFTAHSSIVTQISFHLLEWIIKTPKIFLIDCFNYVIAKLCDAPSDFHNIFHQRIIMKIEMLPKNLNDLIIYNMPLHVFEPKKPPLYSDLVLEDETMETLPPTADSFSNIDFEFW